MERIIPKNLNSIFDYTWFYHDPKGVKDKFKRTSPQRGKVSFILFFIFFIFKNYFSMFLFASVTSFHIFVKNLFDPSHRNKVNEPQKCTF